MSMTTIGIIGIVLLIIGLFSRMPVGFVMALLGLAGFSYVVNFDAGLNLLARDIWDTFSSRVIRETRSSALVSKSRLIFWYGWR